MPVDHQDLATAEQQLKSAVAERIADAAVDMLRVYLIANPASTPSQVLNALFPDATALVVPDAVIDAMVRGVRREVITVGTQRRLTWVGP